MEFEVIFKKNCGIKVVLNNNNNKKKKKKKKKKEGSYSLPLYFAEHNNIFFHKHTHKKNDSREVKELKEGIAINKTETT